MTIKTKIDYSIGFNVWRVHCDGTWCGFVKPLRGDTGSSDDANNPLHFRALVNKDAAEEGWLVADPYHYCPKCQDLTKINNSVDTVSRKERERV